jgi:hypothetical protein
VDGRRALQHFRSRCSPPGRSPARVRKASRRCSSARKARAFWPSWRRTRPRSSWPAATIRASCSSATSRPDARSSSRLPTARRSPASPGRPTAISSPSATKRASSWCSISGDQSTTRAVRSS